MGIRRRWGRGVAGTATYNAAKPAEKPDSAPDPSFSPQGDVRYFQGDVATHGLHVLFNVESDNATLPVPLDEAQIIDHQLILPGRQGNVGGAYSQQFVTPAITLVTPWLGG